MSILEEIIKAGIEAKVEEHLFKSQEEADAETKKFTTMLRPNFKVGDLVERNEMGKKKYNLPKKNMTAIVVKKFDEIDYDDGDANDIIICIGIGKGQFRHFPSDSRFYQKRGAMKEGNVHKFTPKGDDDA